MWQFQRFYWVTVDIRKSVNWNQFIRTSSMDFTWLGIDPPTEEPGPANQNEFFPILGLHYRQKNSSVSSAVCVAGLRRSHWWRSQMWRSWAGMITRCLWLWGRLDVLPNSQKWCWRQLMVEKLTLNSLTKALVDIPAVSMPIARSLKIETSVALYCVTKLHILEWPQHKVYLCNDHAV